ncbi:hypothetical protein GCM10023224_08360 [Streptomonospora halophila]|uniref:Uncharacterized protein n=1 Tax=Streptomonospora halophila TaxID=427369 RepID=A0ABP9GAL0_9ACTN
MADRLPVAVIGAGPVGPAAAAEVERRGLPAVVLEKGAEAGAAMREWGHVRLFSSWRGLVSPAAEKPLAVGGWLAEAAAGEGEGAGGCCGSAPDPVELAHPALPVLK